jgi:hypothetical protein
MTHHTATPALALILALTFLSGCGATTSAPSSLGRSFAATPEPANPALAPTGDPPAERHGTVPENIASKEDTPSSLAPSPQIALLRYAQVYTNWQAASLPATDRQLASLAVGAARLTAEQLTASNSAAAELAANHVQNKGTVLAIAARRGPARDQWIVVTEEQTTGTGPYAGLPPTLHVTLARTKHLNHSWAISGWTPRT